MMECGQDQERLVLLLNDQLEGEELAALEAHLAACAECRRELEATRHVLQLLGEMPVPEPSGDAQVRFDAMLDAYQDSAVMRRQEGSGGWRHEGTERWRREGAGSLGWFAQLFGARPGLAVAYSLVLIVAGLGLGISIHRPAPPAPAADPQLAALNARVGELQEMIMKSLLQNPSASERIRGVSYTGEMQTANKSVIDALLSTLNNDPNVNVRLMTLEALVHYGNNPVVREGLVESILQQESPLVQAALADAMLKLQERNAIKPFKKLLQQKDLNVLVRGKIEKAIARLG
jgi:hypothetical protein